LWIAKLTVRVLGAAGVTPPPSPGTLYAGDHDKANPARDGQEADQRVDVPLEREGQNASRGRRQLWPKPIRQIVHERMQHRQAGVASTDAVAPALHQMIQKAQDAVGRQALQRKRGQSLPRLAAPILKQETEGVAVS